MGINVAVSPLRFNAFRPNTKRTVLVFLKIMVMVSVSEVTHPKRAAGDGQCWDKYLQRKLADLLVERREPLGRRSGRRGLYGNVGHVCVRRWDYAGASLWRDGGLVRDWT